MTPVNYFTVDFEEWFHGLTSASRQPELWNGYERRAAVGGEWLLSALERAGVKATFFIVGLVARETPGITRAIAGAGHEIGLHGHAHRMVCEMTREAFAADLDEGIAALKEATGATPLGFRAPCFSVDGRTPWLWEELAARGVKYSSSVFPIRTTLYGYPGGGHAPFIKQTPHGPIKELPMTVYRAGGVNLPFSGGFYLRALPYAVTRTLIRRLNARGTPVIVYCHPWEFDPDHPVPEYVTARERLSHYGFLKGARDKYLRLLDDFPFAPLGRAL